MSRVVTNLLVVLILAAPVTARPDVQWAVWSNPVGNVATGTFNDRQSVQLTATFSGSSASIAAGSSYTTNPPVPGRPDATNPPGISVMTGTPGGALCVKDGQFVCPPYPTVATLELAGVPASASLTFGLTDLKEGTRYAVEFRNAALTVLPLTNVEAVPYNIAYNTDPLFGGTNMIADYNSVLLGNVLWVDSIHDAGGFYTHTGLTTLINLPSATRQIRLYYPGPGAQNVEGIQLSLGMEIPGDCDANGIVTIAEVQSSINMFLGLNEVRSCVDTSGDNTVSIAEVQKAINGFLGI